MSDLEDEGRLEDFRRRFYAQKGNISSSAARVIVLSGARALPNAGNAAFFQTDLSNARNDDIQLLAFRVDKAFTLPGGYKVTGMFDLFNVMNTNAVTNFNLANGSKFNQINATVDPRTAQIGIRLSF